MLQQHAYATVFLTLSLRAVTEIEPNTSKSGAVVAACSILTLRCMKWSSRCCRSKGVWHHPLNILKVRRQAWQPAVGSCCIGAVSVWSTCSCVPLPCVPAEASFYTHLLLIAVRLTFQRWLQGKECLLTQVSGPACAHCVKTQLGTRRITPYLSHADRVFFMCVCGVSAAACVPAVLIFQTGSVWPAGLMLSCCSQLVQVGLLQTTVQHSSVH